MSEPTRHVRRLSALSAQGARPSPHPPVVRTVTSRDRPEMREPTGAELGGHRRRDVGGLWHVSGTCPSSSTIMPCQRSFQARFKSSLGHNDVWFADYVESH